MIKPLAVLIALLTLPLPAFAETARDYIKPCNAGDQQACLRGSQLAQTNEQAKLLIDFATKGCALGNVISCSDRGMFHLMGIGGPVNLPKAVPLIKKGCADGYSRACANLGWMHYSGRGVSLSKTKAVKFYKMGCDGVSGPACANLAQMYETGEGVTRDYARADRLYLRACDLGYQRAC